MTSRIPILIKRIQKNPNDSLSKFVLALELISTNKKNEAQILFENILTKNPDYVGVYYHLAGLYIDLGENNKGINAYKKGIETAKKLGDTHAESELVSALATIL